MNKKSSKGLGKGFDALMPKDIDNIINQQSEDRTINLFITDIEPNPDQPRKKFEQEKLNELSQSIKQYGVLQPIIVANNISKDAESKYIIIAGERRWRASKLAGLNKIPAIVRSSKELEKLEISIVENIQREDLSPLEQAESIGKLHEVFGVSYEAIAKRLNKAESTINNIVRLLQLPANAKHALSEKQISEGHARSILSLKKNEALQEKLLELIIKNNWSVRQAEQYVVAAKDNQKDTAKAKMRASSTNEDTERLSKILKYPVTVSNMAKGGRLVIRFKSDDEFSNLVQLLQRIENN